MGLNKEAKLIHALLKGREKHMVNNIEGPKGFVIGKAPAQQGAYPGFATITEYRPAYIRLNKECADVIFIQRNGDYSGGFVRMPHNAVILNMAA